MIDSYEKMDMDGLHLWDQDQMNTQNKSIGAWDVLGRCLGGSGGRLLGVHEGRKERGE